MTDTYKCAVCGETYEKGIPDEEARAEQHDLFPGVADEDCAIVCDDCFKLMGLG
jgi:hypothetical protein